jgi:site-specific recombinase XerD
MSNLYSTGNLPSNQFGPSDTPPRPSSNQWDIDDVRYFMEGFILHQKSRRHSPDTIKFYIDRLGRLPWFLDHQGYPTRLTEITTNHLRHFLIYLSEQEHGRWGSTNHAANHPLAQSSIHAYAKALRAFFRWASKEAGLPRNPFENIQMPQLPNQWQVETLNDEEIAALFAAIDSMGHPFIVQRNRACLAILLDSGLRASELLSLRVDDVNLQEGIFTVTGKGQKVRTVVIGHFARRELWAYLSRHRLQMGPGEKALFLAQGGSPLSYNGLRLMFQRLRELTGITRVGVHAHICRHTAATKMYRNGMKGATLQEILGHSKFDTTRRYYLAVSTEDLKNEHELYGPLDQMGDTLKARTGKLPNAPQIPDAASLAREVARSNYRAVARRYGVSDTAIRKRLKKAGLL